MNHTYLVNNKLSHPSFPIIIHCYFEIQAVEIYKIYNIMNTQCSICLQLLSTKNYKVKSTPCGHLFHSHCLERAIQTNGNCPQCRKSCTASIRGPHKVYMNFAGTGSTQSGDKGLGSYLCQIGAILSGGCQIQ